MVDISIIIPAYNEAERIGPTLKSFDSHLSQQGMSYEIIVVDDGSTDRTVQLVESMRPEMPHLVVIALPGNKGKGCAIRTGMLGAKGAVRLFSDADGSTPVSEMDKVLASLASKDTDVCIGSRYLDRSEIEQKQSIIRRAWSRFTNIIVQKILLPGIVDPHCGFKAFKSASAIEIFSQCEINEWSFDLEVLALARHLQLKIVEVPVKWSNDDRSKARLSHLPKEIHNLYRIKRRLHKARVR
jgi:dolichyl-phosphate beta-glucosyltransferase